MGNIKKNMVENVLYSHPSNNNYYIKCSVSIYNFFLYYMYHYVGS